MVAFSSLKNSIKFLFDNYPTNPKHKNLLHPLIADLISVGAVIIATNVLDKIYPSP